MTNQMFVLCLIKKLTDKLKNKKNNLAASQSDLVVFFRTTHGCIEGIKDYKTSMKSRYTYFYTKELFAVSKSSCLKILNN